MAEQTKTEEVARAGAAGAARLDPQKEFPMIECGDLLGPMEGCSPPGTPPTGPGGCWHRVGQSCLCQCHWKIDSSRNQAAGAASQNYLDESHRVDVVDWLTSKGFTKDRERGVIAIAWSCRSGIDYTDLEFYPLARRANDVGWDAIVGHHASGSNPRLDIGRCETLADVQMVYETIRRINGYQRPEDDPNESRRADGDAQTQSSASTDLVSRPSNGAGSEPADSHHPEPDSAAGAARAPLEERAVALAIIQRIVKYLRGFYPPPPAGHPREGDGYSTLQFVADMIDAQTNALIATTDLRAARAGDPAAPQDASFDKWLDDASRQRLAQAQEEAGNPYEAHAHQAAAHAFRMARDEFQLRRAFDPAAPSGWQAIETAPKDGTMILVYPAPAPAGGAPE